jgi:cation diffusion facilitator CzcD-associated flavoprotein CzcO
MADFVVPHRPFVSDAKSRLAAPLNSERHVDIICIGAGASGLLQAYKIQKHFQNMSITVFEKNAEVSGTWYENKYPGYVS